ncbi:hypothetical protein [Mycolicibacterium sp. P9-64]|uniref:hypothetical protein n=1 Tax=Mycolicibacterium sp. P9-64 TaxID=2024612 RepID=UPI0011EE0153|nr:hypothetical protein [Mycolicibacterium sp. P9-64]
MNEHDASAKTGPGDEGLPASRSDESPSRYGDPAHDLFGHGWAPNGKPANTEYTGRHRAPDA